ncbi:MAG: hypothetical protein AB2L18_12700 [Anaerolineaceae bacterium]
MKKKRVDDMMAPTRDGRDETYVIDLCDNALGMKSQRQKTFDFLRGDFRTGRSGKRLPVDAYYSSLQLVIEYRERQHTEAVPFFDKPEYLTVTGVNRGIQRKIYDQRRRDILPQHGIDVIEVSFSDLAHDGRGRLLRERSADLAVIKRLLSQWLNREPNK